MRCRSLHLQPPQATQQLCSLQLCGPGPGRSLELRQGRSKRSEGLGVSRMLDRERERERLHLSSPEADSGGYSTACLAMETGFPIAQSAFPEPSPGPSPLSESTQVRSRRRSHHRCFAFPPRRPALVIEATVLATGAICQYCGRAGRRVGRAVLPGRPPLPVPPPRRRRRHAPPGAGGPRPPRASPAASAAGGGRMTLPLPAQPWPWPRSLRTPLASPPSLAPAAAPARALSPLQPSGLAPPAGASGSRDLPAVTAAGMRGGVRLAGAESRACSPSSARQLGRSLASWRGARRLGTSRGRKPTALRGTRTSRRL